jgi:hypothetical protein
MEKKCCTCGEHLRLVVVSLYDVEPDTGKFVIVAEGEGSHSILCSKDPKHYTGWEFVEGELRGVTDEAILEEIEKGRR